jgi:hypothetical protein
VDMVLLLDGWSPAGTLLSPGSAFSRKTLAFLDQSCPERTSERLALIYHQFHQVKTKVIGGRNIAAREKKARNYHSDWNRGAIVSPTGRRNNMILRGLQQIARKLGTGR